MLDYSDNDEYRKTVAKRLRAARMEIYSGPSAAAEALGDGTAQSSISMWESAIRIPLAYSFFKLAKLFKVHAGYLAGFISDQIHPRNLLNKLDNEELLGIHRKIYKQHNVDTESTFITLMPDNSMSGEIENGEVVVIDISVNKLSGSHIYAVKNGDSLLIRHIIDDLGDTATIRSEMNDIYPDQVIKKIDLDGKIIGRLRFSLRIH